MRAIDDGKSRASWALALAVLAALLAMAAAGSAAATPTLTVLHSFAGAGDGKGPAAGVIIDSKGNLYGTATRGGTTDNGVVFKLRPDGNLRVLKSFCIQHDPKGFGCLDGSGPEGGLIADASGNLYGTTVVGGATDNGVVFVLSPTRAYTVLYSFCSAVGCTDGALPLAGLIADSSGNLYGTTEDGGGPDCFCGMVFELSPGGAETALYSFQGHTKRDGANPMAGLIADGAGNLYGTTFKGGRSSICGEGCGTVFKLAPGGSETVLHSFCSLHDPNTGFCLDGSGPAAGLVADSEGSLYGTAEAGGASNQGVVFKISPRGDYKVLHSFAGSDGDSPPADLIIDSKGDLFGTTVLGGAFDLGTVFKLSRGGTLTVLHSFSGFPNDGEYPAAGLIADSKGRLYGTTSGGGSVGGGSDCGDNRGCGTVYKLTGAGFAP